LTEGVDDQFWFGQNRDRVRLKAGAGSLAGFELAIEDNGGKGEFLFGEAELGAKEDLGLADTAEFLERQSASASVSGKIG